MAIANLYFKRKTGQYEEKFLSMIIKSVVPALNLFIGMAALIVIVEHRFLKGMSLSHYKPNKLPDLTPDDTEKQPKIGDLEIGCGLVLVCASTEPVTWKPISNIGEFVGKV